jgi:spore coat polysaccharide biosynthesis protein SpsF
MIVLIVQARVGSTRLPGKALRTILGKPMLGRQLERLKGAKRVDAFVVATTDRPEDDAIAVIAKSAGFEVFRGSERDVLDRFYKAAKKIKADVVVRVTGDCPLHDPDLVDMVVGRFLDSGANYAKTPDNYPEGLDTEVFSFAALEAAWKEGALPSEREHVTPFIRNRPERFKVDAWRDGDFDHSACHWSVDTERDFTFIEAIYQELYKEGTMFHMKDVLGLLERRPELLDINKGGTGYEGLEKSKKEDGGFKKRHA